MIHTRDSRVVVDVKMAIPATLTMQETDSTKCSHQHSSSI
jgi:hypothetical protein